MISLTQTVRHGTVSIQGLHARKAGHIMSRLKLIRIGLYRQAKAFHHESSGAQNRKPCIGMKRIELITEEVLNATGRIWAASRCGSQTRGSIRDQRTGLLYSTAAQVRELVLTPTLDRPAGSPRHYQLPQRLDARRTWSEVVRERHLHFEPSESVSFSSSCFDPSTLRSGFLLLQVLLQRVSSRDVLEERRSLPNGST